MSNNPSKWKSILEGQNAAKIFDLGDLLNTTVEPGLRTDPPPLQKKPIQGETFELSSTITPSLLSIAISTMLGTDPYPLLLTYVGKKSQYVHREVMSI